MKALIYHSRTQNLTMIVKRNEDGTLFLTADGKKSIDHHYAGSLIKSLGGIDQFLAKCEEVDLGEVDAEGFLNAKIQAKEHARRISRLRQAEKQQAQRDQARAAFEQLKAEHGEVIPTTLDNLYIVMTYLNTCNWGGWQLPKMSIGYSVNQYDCDGKTATTVTLDEPLNGITRFVIGAPHGYLTKYTNISRLA